MPLQVTRELRHPELESQQVISERSSRQSGYARTMMYRLVRWTFQLLSLLSLQQLRAVARILAWIAWCLRLRPVRTTIRNLELCFSQLSEDERESLARESLYQTACVAMESAALWNWSPARLNVLFEQPDGHAEISVAASGGPVLLACPHLGNWEFLAYSLATEFGITALYQARRMGGYERCIVESRTRFGAAMVDANWGGIRTLLKRLKSGGTVAVLPDQVPTKGNGIVAEFMGRKAVTATLFHELQQRTEAQSFLGVCDRVENGFRMRYVPIEEAIESSDPLASCNALNRAIEAEIHRIPSQYQWEYKRFRRVSSSDIYRTQ